MKVVIERDHEAMSVEASRRILREVGVKADLLLGVATGGTPTRAYELITAAARADALLSRVRVFKIDEWGGLAMDEPASCEVYVREKVLGAWGISEDRYVGWRSDASDPENECERIRRWLEGNGPMDLCVLGIGTNGHLALIEPGEAVRAGPHVAKLAETSLKHPMLANSRGAARYGLTIGMGDILKSKKVLVLASGEGKREVVRRLLEGDSVTPRFPASFLRLHSDVTLILDAAAGGH